MSRILLIVDDMPSVARSLSRFLRPAFDQVFIAHTVDDADRLLADSNASPTHLVSDHFLGANGALGADLVPIWRAKYPRLRAAVLLTGAGTTGIVAENGVDVVFRKPPNVHELRDYLTSIP